MTIGAPPPHIPDQNPHTLDPNPTVGVNLNAETPAAASATEGAGVSQADPSAPRRIPFTPPNAKLPTMQVVMQALESEGLNYNSVTNFSSSLPGTERNPQLGTFIKTDAAGRKFSCFQGEMTFSIHAQKNGKPIILEFTQTIETSVPVPSGNKDNKEVKDALMHALFKLEGYRLAISEPLLQGENERIDLLAKKTFIGIATIRAHRDEGFYGQSIRWEKKDPKTYSWLEKVFGATDYVSGSFMGVQIEGKKKEGVLWTEEPHDLRTLWTKTPVCEAVAKRNKTLSDIVKVTKILNEDTAVAVNKQIQKSLLESSVRTMDNALTVLARNAFDDIDDLDLKVNKLKMAYNSNVDSYKKVKEEAEAFDPKITALEGNPDKKDELSLLKFDQHKKLEEANAHKKRAETIHEELKTGLEGIHEKISSIKAILETPGITLSLDPEMVKKVKETHTGHLKKLEKTLKKCDLDEEIKKMTERLPAEEPPAAPPS